ncbi:universal stress protein [Streptomyces sp. NPDC058231]|uniref:universal stress protein n=1 Tax=Streptomyces sp. NPDC058231 TaxID=3346392 RepID=UPI0036EBF003
MDAAETGRVVAGVSGSLGSLTALHRAAAEAHRTHGELWAVLAWEPPGGESGARHTLFPAQLDTWRTAAAGQLLEALDAAFGPAGPGVPLRRQVARGSAARVLVETADRCDDVLVVGAGHRGLLRPLFPSVARYCVAHARCPVLTVPPSPLERDWELAHRRNVWGLSLDAGSLDGDRRNT